MLKLLKSPKPFLKFATAALLLAIPLYPKFPFISVPGTFVSIRLEDFLILLASIAWFLTILPNWKQLFKSKLNISIMIFLGVTLVSVFYAVTVTKTAPLHIGLLHWVRRVEYLLMFFIGLEAVKSKKDLRFFVKLFSIVVLVAFLYGLGQKYFKIPIVTTQNFEYSKGVALRYTPGGHLPSTFAGHYDLATYLILVMPIFITSFLATKSKTKKIILGFSFASGYWLLLSAASRISLVSYLMAGTLTFWLVKKYKFIPVFIILSLIIAGTSNSLISRYTRVIKVTVEKVLGIGDETSFFLTPVQAQELPVRRSSPTPTAAQIPIFEDRSTSIRINVEWPRAIRAFSKNPLLGTGFSSISLATDGDYLRLLGEVGILGFVSFLTILIGVASRLLSALPFKKLNFEFAFIIAALAALPGIMLNAVFIDVFEASKLATMFWLTMGMAVATVKLVKKDEIK